MCRSLVRLDKFYGLVQDTPALTGCVFGSSASQTHRLDTTWCGPWCCCCCCCWPYSLLQMLKRCHCFAS